MASSPNCTSPGSTDLLAPSLLQGQLPDCNDPDVKENSVINQKECGIWGSATGL